MQGQLSAALAVAEANADRAEQIEREAAEAQLQFARVGNMRLMYSKDHMISSIWHDNNVVHGHSGSNGALAQVCLFGDAGRQSFCLRLQRSCLQLS